MLGSMEKVEDLLKGLQLSDADRKKVHIGSGSSSTEKPGATPQKAFRKLLSERAIHPEVIEQAVGWTWCPVREIECKDLGENFSSSPSTRRREAKGFGGGSMDGVPRASGGGGL